MVNTKSIAKKLAALISLMIVTAAAAQQREAYQVVAFDAATGQWTIVDRYTDEKGVSSQKRIIAVCAFYKKNKHPMDKGRDACDLSVGQTIVSNIAPKAGEQVVDVWFMSSKRMAMTFGRGDDPEGWTQQLDILRQEVIP